MISDNDILKLILGFKIKHLRLDRKISYQALSNATGLSVSYLNDIEKGKKYPKPDKINALAQAFGLEYDELVSTRTDKKLRPVIDLLNSGFFRFFPLKEFGISTEKLIDVFSNSPDKFSAFISTILKMVRTYQIEKEHFYRVALRSYQDMHDNYFPELEEAVTEFKKEVKLSNKSPKKYDDLEDVLRASYDITVDRNRLTKIKKLSAFRSYYQVEKKILYLNEGLSESQENFILAKEIGFHFLKITERPYETMLNKEASFEKLLNNFKASYFAAALLLDAKELVKDIESMARSTTWKPNLIGKLIDKYQVTPETFLQRLTNILPHYFNIRDLFFIRLKSTDDLIKYDITKELHLSQLHNPYHTELDEHLCHRWVSISGIKKIRSSKGNKVIDAQVSNYWQTKSAYFCITVAESSSFTGSRANSITLGLMMTDALKGTFNFLKDKDLKVKTVHTTCERCSIPDCDNRVAPPTYVDNINHENELEAELEKL
ncbi:MAG: transcriptional regulator with XRE-family HTH domain/Zn-dependent peptidase ImmA (M78 family) [Cyclobacteriaceae bacterium]|jgi:transcriptional regulator with XRE-family HTH domain/Zn-dependent peptidase ImmA (M78 family)